MTAWQNMVRGVAIGDAWGHRLEFRKIEDITKDDPRGPELPEILEITDDTQMTLYLGAALDDSWEDDIESMKAAIIESFLIYNRDPDNNRAPGITVTGSLSALERSESRDWMKTTSHTSDGSGTVMRTSPTAFLPEDRWVGATAFAAAITHGSANGIAAAILNAAILREILAGNVKPGWLLARALELSDKFAAAQPDTLGLEDWVGDYIDEVSLSDGFAFISKRLETALVALPRLQDDPWATASDPSLVIDNSGWRAPHTLVIALTALDMFPGDAWSAVRRAAVTDGDSDTIAAVAGALAGAAYPEVFTKAWTEGLRDRFEARYRRWIEFEADQYPFADPESRKPLRFGKLDIGRLLRR